MLSRGKTIESESLVQIVEMLSSTLRHGGGSLVEIYKRNDNIGQFIGQPVGHSIGHTSTMNMLAALSFIDKVATV